MLDFIAHPCFTRYHTCYIVADNNERAVCLKANTRILLPINHHSLLLPLTMPKRGGDSTRIRGTKVKKRKGVGFRSITVLESDEDTPTTATDDYARVTKARVGTAGKIEGITVSSIPVFEAKVNIHAPLEMDTNHSIDAIAENVVPVVPAKKKKGNDSVSARPSEFPCIANVFSDQDALLACCAVYRA